MEVDRYLERIGFGDGFFEPLALNRRGPHDAGNGTYELIASPQGATLTRHGLDGVSTPLYCFQRVAHQLDDFTPVSDSMQVDPTKHWQSKPFATRLPDGGGISLRTQGFDRP